MASCVELEQRVEGVGRALRRARLEKERRKREDNHMQSTKLCASPPFAAGRPPRSTTVEAGPAARTVSREHENSGPNDNSTHDGSTPPRATAALAVGLPITSFLIALSAGSVGISIAHTSNSATSPNLTHYFWHILFILHDIHLHRRRLLLHPTKYPVETR